MQWFKKWWHERYGNPSNDQSLRGGNKCKKGSSNEQSVGESKSRLALSRESICENSDKDITTSSPDNCSPSDNNCTSSTSHASVHTNNNNNQSNLKSIESHPIACRLRQQAKDLESLISGSVSSDGSINVEHEANATGSLPELLQPDEFFENPDDIRCYKEKNAFIDEYIIIDIKEVEAITKHSEVLTGSDKKSKPVKYQTTEFSTKPPKVKPQPSMFSFATYCYDGYGLFYGSPSFSLSQFPETFSYRTFDDDSMYHRNYKGQGKRRYKNADRLYRTTATSSSKLNSSTEILEGKVDAFEKSLMGPLLNEIPTPCANVKEKFSIQKTFGLSDDGDIIVNVDHIMEEKGCGFLFARQITMFRSVERGDAICEKRCIRRSVLVILKEFFYQLCEFYI